MLTVIIYISLVFKFCNPYIYLVLVSMNSLVIYSVLLILCNFVYPLYLSVLTWLHIAIYSVLDEFHIQSDLRGYWIGESMYICIVE
jgi:hypothetical protein